MDSARAGGVTALILAGGQARRMGGRDKGLVELADRPMIEYVIDALLPQSDHLIINANRNHERYRRYGFPVVADAGDDYRGPLAGVASGLRAASTPLLATAPCDAPLLPRDLIATLREKLLRENAEICTVECNGRLQPVFALLKTGLLPSLEQFLDSGQRKIDLWFDSHRCAVVDYAGAGAFINVNSADELLDAAGQLH